jgi:hypothetical protein
MEEREAAEHNAVAWLSMSDEDLIRCSASLGLPGDLHPEAPHVEGSVKAKKKQIAEARKAADDHAKGHAGEKFVKDWIKANRVED